MKIIDAEGAVMGRLAAYAAKQALQGEEVAIVNCKKAIITGSKENIREKFEEKRGRVGSGQGGPKPSMVAYKIVKYVIRGMLPNYRYGKGRVAFKKIKCYNDTPKEFEDKKKISMKADRIKFYELKRFARQNG